MVRKGDSNPHGFPRQILSDRACTAFEPRAVILSAAKDLRRRARSRNPGAVERSRHLGATRATMACGIPRCLRSRSFAKPLRKQRKQSHSYGRSPQVLWGFGAPVPTPALREAAHLTHCATLQRLECG